MDSREMQYAVEIELEKSNPYYQLKDKLSSEQIFYYLTRSERDYVQDIYNNGLDKNEENKKKLGKLLIAVTLNSGISESSFYPNSYEVLLPEDVLYVINERANITSDGESISNLYIKPISYDEYNVNKDNPFRKPTTEKCLRLEGVNLHVILLPNSGTQVLNEIYLDYVKTPLGIDLTQDCELHENVHPNIIKGAVKLIKAAQEEQAGYQIQDKEERENK